MRTPGFRGAPSGRWRRTSRGQGNPGRECMRLRVEVRFGTQAHPVLIDTHGAALVASWLARSRRPSVVVTDARVARRVWPGIARALRRRGLVFAPPIVLRGGE